MTTKHEQDTIAWLISADGCPYCGAAMLAADRSCRTCRRPLMVIVRPPRSTLMSSLTGLWGLGAGIGLLIGIGAWAQSAGLLQRADPAPPPQLLVSLAWVLGVEALDQPVKAAPPPAWLVPATLAGALLCAGMAWGCAVRRAWALYAGLALGALPLIAGLAAALGTRGTPAILALAAGLAGTALIALLHMAVAGELRGELRQISSAPAATSAAGLFEAGRACYRRGLTFLAARQWARASAKDSSNPAYLHALALALAQLGLRERARAIVRRALELAPGDPELSALAEQLGKPG